MAKDYYEEDPWEDDDMSHAEKQRALYRIYAFMLSTLGLMPLFMVAHLMQVHDEGATEVDNVSKSISISKPPEEQEAKKLYTADETSHEEPAPEEVYVFYNVPLSDDVQRYTQDLCDVFGVQYAHVLATMKVESNYTHTAISPQNHNGSTDWGIMQINSGNHKWLEGELGITDWLDLQQNILAGVYILSHYNYHGDNFQAISMFYNSGPSKGRTNHTNGIYTAYSYEAVKALEELEARNENLRTEKR